jgi:hypothetical protein
VLKFNISATSSNKEEKNTLFDNEHFVYVVLEAIPGIALIGKKYQEQVIYETKLNEIKTTNESEIGPEIIQEYKIINKGPSKSLKSQLLISWQKELQLFDKKMPFLYLMDMPYTEGQIKCNIQNIDINSLNFTVNKNILLVKKN